MAPNRELGLDMQYHMDAVPIHTNTESNTMQINYKTGRNYGTEQVLQITVEQDIEADYAMRDIVATFVDSSRRISGRVHTTLFGSDDIGESVLREYDAGRYTTI